MFVYVRHIIKYSMFVFNPNKKLNHGGEKFADCRFPLEISHSDSPLI